MTPDPEVLSIFLRDSAQVRMGFDFTMAVEVPNGEGKKPGWITIPTPFANQKQPLTTTRSAIPERPLTKAGDGPISFVPGEVLELRAILDKARPHLSGSVIYDKRIAQSKYYIRGRFSGEQFLAAMRQMTRVNELEAAQPPTAEVAKLVDGILGRLGQEVLGRSTWVAELGIDNILERKDMTIGDLSKASTFLSSFFSKRNLPPDTKLRTRPAIAFTLDSGGYRMIGDTKFANTSSYIVF
jgi:hypothetical protein